MTTPAPKSAATPTAPVCIGTPAPAELALEPDPEPDPLEGEAPPPIDELGCGTPEVNGTLDTMLAPLKPGAPAVAEADGEADVLFGLSTLRHVSIQFTYG